MNMYTTEMFERASKLFDGLIGQIPEQLTIALDIFRPRVIISGFDNEEFDYLSLACKDEHVVWGALLKDGEIQIIHGYDIDKKDFSLCEIIEETDYLFNL